MSLSLSDKHPSEVDEKSDDSESSLGVSSTSSSNAAHKEYGRLFQMGPSNTLRCISGLPVGHAGYRHEHGQLPGGEQDEADVGDRLDRERQQAVRRSPGGALSVPGCQWLA